MVTKNAKSETTGLQFVLAQDKVGKGSIRFMESVTEKQKKDGYRAVNVYLTKEQVKAIGSPESITLTIAAAAKKS